jgi:hypothetical protein
MSSPSKAMKAVLAHLSKPFNAKARKSLTPSPRNMRNNGTTGYKAVLHHKPYFMKVIKKNGKWIQDPSNKKYYIKSGNKFVAPEHVSYWE